MISYNGHITEIEIDVSLLEVGLNLGYVADASELGIRPGERPDALVVADVGNGMPFYLTSTSPDRWRYLQGNGCLEIIVFND